METTENMTDDELEALVAKARKDDESALARLCEAYYRKVLKFMYYRVGENCAEDLTNEVFLRVARNIGGQKGRFEPWLYRIARNLVIDRSRHRKASPEVEMDESLQETVGDGSDGRARSLARMDVKEGVDEDLLASMLEEARLAVEHAADLPSLERQRIVAHAKSTLAYQKQVLADMKDQACECDCRKLDRWMDRCQSRWEWMCGIQEEQSFQDKQYSPRQWREKGMASCPMFE